MTEKDIRPVPKNILKRIRKLDGKYYPSPDGHVRCYAYLTTWKNELVKVTVAVKHRYKKWYCKQVAIHGLDSDKCFVGKTNLKRTKNFKVKLIFPFPLWRL